MGGVLPPVSAGHPHKGPRSVAARSVQAGGAGRFKVRGQSDPVSPDSGASVVVAEVRRPFCQVPDATSPER